MKISLNGNLNVGDIAFLTSTFNNAAQREYINASDMPGTKNLSGEKILRGWLGETNGVNRRALGAVRIATIDEGEFVGDTRFATVEELPDADPAVIALCERNGIAAQP